jgi:multiple sugar transport system substrate-binding protein
MNKKAVGALAAAAAAVLALSACGSGGEASGASGDEAKGEISYWLWDSNQLPAYQQCADDFHTANPDITVKITQRGWDDYWSTLTNGFVAGTAPDVFTDHLAKYPEFAGSARTASATACPRTGTRSRSSTTRSSPPGPELAMSR